MRCKAASEHAQHFLNERVTQVERLAGILDRPPIDRRAVRRGIVRPLVV